MITGSIGFCFSPQTYQEQRPKSILEMQHETNKKLEEFQHKTFAALDEMKKSIANLTQGQRSSCDASAVSLSDLDMARVPLARPGHGVWLRDLPVSASPSTCVSEGTPQVATVTATAPQIQQNTPSLPRAETQQEAFVTLNSHVFKTPGAGATADADQEGTCLLHSSLPAAGSDLPRDERVAQPQEGVCAEKVAGTGLQALVAPPTSQHVDTAQPAGSNGSSITHVPAGTIRMPTDVITLPSGAIIIPPVNYMHGIVSSVTASESLMAVLGSQWLAMHSQNHAVGGSVSSLKPSEAHASASAGGEPQQLLPSQHMAMLALGAGNTTKQAACKGRGSQRTSASKTASTRKRDYAVALDVHARISKNIASFSEVWFMWTTPCGGYSLHSRLGGAASRPKHA